MERPRSTRGVLVFGAGISGLAAAQALAERGIEPIVCEKAPTLGGLTRTIAVDDFCFDYTGHFLHLSRYPTPADVPFASLDNNEWQQVERTSLCLVEGELVPAPLQYNIGHLPEKALKRAVESYDNRPNLASGDATFRDFIVSGFGEYLSDKFLIPLNEKTMAISLDRLSAKAVRRFFPLPDETKVRSGMSVSTMSSDGYNAKFWYPKRGGIELLVRGLSRGLNDVRTLQQLTKLDLDSRIATTRTGQSYSWDVLYTSIPLKNLCLMSSAGDLQRIGQSLSHSSTISFSFGLSRAPTGKLARAQWVYVADRDIPFYRAGWYSNASNGVSPAGQASMYVEVGVPGDQVDSVKVDVLQKSVVKNLEKLGWLDRNDILCAVINVLRCAYVHHTHDRDELVSAALERLNRSSVYPVGRYGLWDYTSMEDGIFTAIETVRKTV